MRSASFIKRIHILAIILLSFMAIFVLRLFWLQVVHHGDYVAIAKQTQQRSFTIPAKRGEIYMMDGKKAVPVVLNRTLYSVVADPVVAKKKDEIIDLLREVAGGEMVADAEKRLSNKKSRYEILAKNLSRAQVEKVKKRDFSGVGFQSVSVRNYVEGSLASQTLGFVNAEGEGQYGVEQGLDKQLRGSDGMLQSVTDIKNVPLNINKDSIRVEPKPGQDVVLSIDRNIQNYAEEALGRGLESTGATEGSVLVMNPSNGQVLAMANLPGFNPSDYSSVEDASIFVNSITMEPYEPASVIKTFVIATGIDKGTISPGTPYYNTDCIQVVDREMCNATRGLIGTMTMQDALNNSLNVGSILAARSLGGGSVDLVARQTMYEYYYNKFKLGQETGIEVGEVKGHIYKPNTLEGGEVRYSAMTFGQGLSLTMVQVASGFSAMINGGEYYRPTIIAGQVDASGEVLFSKNKPTHRSVSSDTSEKMQEMLVTARRSSWVGQGDRPGYNIGGKTGTAETIADDGKYTQSETVATYLGFGGSIDPEYVIMVRVAAPGKGLNLEGGIHASPIFLDVSNWLIDYLKIAPGR